MTDSGERFEVAYLILHENWALQGAPDDVIAVRDNLGEGELITAGDEPGGGPTEGPGEESAQAGPQIVAVPYGERATNQETGQQVRIAKVQANQSVIPNVKENPNWDYVDEDKQYLNLKAPKGDRFWIIHVAWKNVSKKPRITEGDFQLLSENGTEYTLRLPGGGGSPGTKTQRRGRLGSERDQPRQRPHHHPDIRRPKEHQGG